MRGAQVYVISMALVSIGLAGCGLSIPEVGEFADRDYPGDPATNTPPVSATAQIEFEIKKRVYCELREAVYAANHYIVTESATLSGPRNKYRPLIPSAWIAQIALSLQIDESIALNSSLSITELMPNAIKKFGVQTITSQQSFNLGLGGTLSSAATRTDKFNPQYSIDFLTKPQIKDSVCIPGNDPFERIPWTTPKSSPFLVESDLGIEKWLVGAMVVNDLLPSETSNSGSERKEPPPARGKDAAAGVKSTSSAGPGGGGGKTAADTVSYEIKFVIVTSDNATPTWKLIPVSVNPASSPFFSTGRTRTHDLIITIGPNTTETSNSNLASQIGQAVKGNPPGL
jgi:hypothetical protein